MGNGSIEFSCLILPVYGMRKFDFEKSEDDYTYMKWVATALINDSYGVGEVIVTDNDFYRYFIILF